MALLEQHLPERQAPTFESLTSWINNAVQGLGVGVVIKGIGSKAREIPPLVAQQVAVLFARSQTAEELFAEQNAISESIISVQRAEADEKMHGLGFNEYVSLLFDLHYNILDMQDSVIDLRIATRPFSDQELIAFLQGNK